MTSSYLLRLFMTEYESCFFFTDMMQISSFLVVVMVKHTLKACPTLWFFAIFRLQYIHLVKKESSFNISILSL